MHRFDITREMTDSDDDVAGGPVGGSLARSVSLGIQERRSLTEQSNLDVAVLIMFFCRPEPLSLVFEQVRKARPSRLYLHQDGPRPERPSDIEGIAACRAIVTNIDWECEVHTLYRDTNIGCGPAQYYAERWMFETEEAGIVLEDDTVPSQAFFVFCRELLERYCDDHRIDRICGMNNTGVSHHTESSYLYALTGSIWGWASWKRVLDTWDPDYAWLDDAAALERLRCTFEDPAEYREFVQTARRRKSIGLPFHETVGGFAQRANNSLMIVPKFNMISSAGATADASHAPSDLRLIPARTRRLFSLEAHEIEFPLIHPKYVMRDPQFERARRVTRGQRTANAIEYAFLLIRYGEFRRILQGLQRRARRRRMNHA